MNALKQEAGRWLEAGRPAVVVEILAVRGSAPREAGTRMLVAADAQAGTIGGGHLEFEAIRCARAALQDGTAALPREQDYALGPSLGQCCGGAVRLRHAPLDVAALAVWPDEAPLFRLQLHGAGHVGRALVRLLATLPCRVQWIDERDDAFPAELDGRPWPPHIERLGVDAVEAEVDAAPPGTFFLVMTHSHDLDLRIVEAVLRRGDFGWCGLIGSATKRARFLHRLAERGVAPQAIARLVCPVGVPGITGKAPEVLALAVAAQLLQAAQAAQERSA